MDVSETLVPKSDQLNADDLLTGPITVTITGIKQGPKDQPVHLMIDGGRQPYKPCKSMRRVLAVAWCLDGSAWVGRSMRLYREPTVKWAGEEIGGVRISHLSHIVEDTEFVLTVSKGVRVKQMIHALPWDTESLAKEIESAKTPQAWSELKDRVAIMPAAARDELRPALVAARERIKAEQAAPATTDTTHATGDDDGND